MGSWPGFPSLLSLDLSLLGECGVSHSHVDVHFAADSHLLQEDKSHISTEKEINIAE